MPLSQIELDRAMKGRSFRRATGRKLTFLPWAKVCCPRPWAVSASFGFWPKAGNLVLVRRRPLGVASFIRDFWKPGRYNYKAKYRYFTSCCVLLLDLFWT
jgi:hypothetical protein